MSKALCLFFLLFAVTIVSAQKLKDSHQTSNYTYIYSVKESTVKALYLGKGLKEADLTNPVDSILTTEKIWPKLPAGNYIKVFAEKSLLKYQLVENRTVYLRLFGKTKNLQFVLLNDKGQEVKEAVVSINGKTIKFDSASQSWLTSKPRKEESLVRIFYRGLANYVSITREEPEARREDRKNHMKQTVKPKIVSLSGYMVFNKPKYKPQDTLKFKSYILQGKKYQPFTRELGLRLMSDAGAKVLGTVKPLHPGSYDYAFSLHDSLKLTLDRSYTLELFQGDQVYSSGNFTFEEYELKSTSFGFRADVTRHLRGQPQNLYFKATDENGLNVMDGRVELRVRSRAVSSFHQARLFVPDTLWQHQLKLDALGETKLVLPDSIFPNADLNYEVLATFFNANNEKREQTQYFSYYTQDKQALKVEAKADSLFITKTKTAFSSNSLSVAVLNDDSDTLERFSLTLPAKLKINPRAALYALKLDTLHETIDLGNYNADLQVFPVHGADSLFVTVNNPRKIPFWYTVMKGNKVVDQGQAITLNYKKAMAGNGLATFKYSYIWADQMVSQQVIAQFLDKQLQLDVTQPFTIAPGEKSTIEIAVTDADGKAVPEVNLTAYSFTSKFNYNARGLPYLGKIEKEAPNGIVLEAEEGLGQRSIKLNWSRWKSVLGLYSMAYFQFTHPNPVYREENPAAEGLTQIAPFVIAKGEILPIAVLYINSQPVYFSQSEQVYRYAFSVENPVIQLQFRLKDKLVTVDSVAVKPGTRLVTSFDLDAINARHIKVENHLPELSIQEADALHPYMIRITDTYSPRFATVKLPDLVYLLRSEPNYRNATGWGKLVGPFTYNLAQFQVKGLAPISFMAETGFSYNFRPGFVRQSSLKQDYLFDRNLKSTRVPDYKDQVLTNKEIDSLWTEYLDLRSHTTNLFNNVYLPAAGNGLLRIKIAEAEKGKTPVLIKNVLLYREDNPDFFNCYPGRTTDLGRLAPGKYKMILLLKGDSYVLAENIEVKANGTNLYEMSLANARAKDSMSMKIAALINEQSIRLSQDQMQVSERMKQTLNSSYASPYTKTMRGFVYDEETNKPLSDVRVKIKGTGLLTTTDVTGMFTLKVPERGKVAFTFIGMQSKELDVNVKLNNKIYLKADHTGLQEVVVVGYGQRDPQMAESLQDLLQGKVAGVSVNALREVATMNGSVMIRGMSMSRKEVAGGAPLYVVDGVIQADALKMLKPEEISEISVLQADAAVAIYGNRALNGVILVTTKKATDKMQADATARGTEGISMRKNFADHAFWQPQLMTDALGKVKFEVTFPDDITNWRTFYLAMNGKRQSGYAENSIKAFKPVSTLLAGPAFVVAGDRFNPIGKISNYTAEPKKVQRRFVYNGETLLDANIAVKDLHLDTMKIEASQADSLKLQYSLKMESGYSDGEERMIPVYKAGVLESKGIFDVLEKDTTVQHRFDQKLGKVTVTLTASILPVLLEETEHLRRYAYFCNEQLASKLKGLLAQKRIKDYLKQPFEHERSIKQLIKKLQDARRQEGTWGWWKNSEAELWISRHVIEAFIAAEKAGYTTGVDKKEMTTYLVYQLAAFKGMDKLDALELLQKMEARVDFKTPIERYEAELRQRLSQSTVYNKFRLIHLKQQVGLPFSMDSLLKYKHQTMLGNLYFGTVRPGYQFFDHTIQNTLLAYQVLKAEGKHKDMLVKMRNYLLEQRATGYWRNTYESSLVLETILPDLFEDNAKLKPSQVVLINKEKKQTIHQFPYTELMEVGDLQVQKKGDLPVYFTAYQQYWNARPEKVSKDFTVKTWFENEQGIALSSLTGGKAVLLKAEVIVSKEGDYVMVEIPIPAGASYDEKEQSWWGKEVHREYAKDKVSIFCRTLKEGKHTFTVKLMPRYDGTYTLNPAKAELMYFPTFYGREGIRQVRIGK